jgi:hypothetical protein
MCSFGVPYCVGYFYPGGPGAAQQPETANKKTACLCKIVAESLWFVVEVLRACW